MLNRWAVTVPDEQRERNIKQAIHQYQEERRSLAKQRYDAKHSLARRREREDQLLDDLRIELAAMYAEAASIQSEIDKVSLVYAVERRDGAIKIGFSTHLRQRVKTLTAEHDPLQLLGTLPGGRDLEASIHVQFAAHRLDRTEWFTPHPALCEFVQQMDHAR